MRRILGPKRSVIRPCAERISGRSAMTFLPKVKHSDRVIPYTFDVAQTTIPGNQHRNPGLAS